MTCRETIWWITLQKDVDLHPNARHTYVTEMPSAGELIEIMDLDAEALPETFWDDVNALKGIKPTACLGELSVNILKLHSLCK